MNCALLLSSLIATGALGSPVAIELPVNGGCDSEQIAAALRAQLPSATIAIGRSEEPGAVQISLQRTADAWAIAISAIGQPELRRPLARLGDDCVALGEAVALIAERYLESIQWTPAPVEVDRLPPPPPPPPLQLSVGLGGGAAIGITGPSPAASVELGVRWGGWLLGVFGLYLGNGRLALVTTTSAAHEEQTTGAVGVALGRRFELKTSLIRLELAPGVGLYAVASAPDSQSPGPNPLPKRTPVLAPVPFLGLRAGYEYFFTARLSVGLRVEARANLPHSFKVEGYDQALKTQLIDGDLVLTVGCLFF